MTPDQLSRGWTPRRVGRRIVLLAEAVSTNSVALDAAEQPASVNRLIGSTKSPPEFSEVDGLVVLADYQTMGRGRLGRAWLSPRGASILCTVLLVSERQSEPVGNVNDDATARFRGWLTLASAVAACEAIRESTEITPAIKWPNDLRIRGRKFGGILIESRRTAADRRAWAIGVGINCLQHEGHFPPELRASATSLEIEASHAIDRVTVTRALIQRLDLWLSEAGQEVDATNSRRVHAAWMDYAEPLGQRVRVVSQGREHAGTMIAIDPFGGLIVQGEDGQRRWFDPMQTTLL